MLAEEAELVEIAALEHDAAVAYPEEAAAPQSKRITPLQDGPLAVLEDLFHLAHHRRARAFDAEQVHDRLAAVQRIGSTPW